MQNHPSVLPVIYVHAKDHGRASHADIKSLLKLAMPLCSRLPGEGLEQTVHGYDQPASLLAELAARYPHRPIIFVRAGLLPTAPQIARLTRLCEQADRPLVLTMLSNAAPAVNPFAGLHQPASNFLHELPDVQAELVRLLAPGHLHTLSQWTDHFVMLSAKAVIRLTAAGNPQALMSRLINAGGKLMVADDLFLPDPDSPLFAPLKLQPHESVYPPAFGKLGARLQAWLNAGISALPGTATRMHQTTLHITHSWGGGVAQWIKSFIDTDRSSSHFQLRSEGLQSNQGYGQKLSLYTGNELRCPVASWWLQPAISSIADESENYQAILAEICRRYGIGRVLVSSLIGHSLDALRSGLPTLHILHDHFPVWPLLGTSPVPYLQPHHGVDLSTALTQHSDDLEFPDKDAAAWAETGTAYLQTLHEFEVKVVAPGQSTLALQCRLVPEFGHIHSSVIPHGVPALPAAQTGSPRPRNDGRLRLIILGRMQAGKGRQLLLDAMPGLVKHVQVYLLGAGQAGESFFGMSGVDVVLNYQRSKLATLLNTIGPDFAALLSVVPETFSFTLSELQQMGIPAIATRNGSFIERIEHGKTGWLIAAEPQALIDQVAALCKAPEQITTVRNALSSIVASTPEKMVAAYNRLCPHARPGRPDLPVVAGTEAIQASAADFQRTLAGNQLRLAVQQQAKLADEVRKRTKWAQQTSQQLQLEQTRYKQWVERLQAEIDRLQQMVAERQLLVDTMDSRITQFEADQLQLQAANQQLQAIYQQLTSDYQQITDLNTLILNSTSWKITRPLRAARRIVTNFMLARAWNPARWPWLLSQLVRNLATLGLHSTLKRLQYGGPEAVPEPRPEALVEAVGNLQPPVSFAVPSAVDVSIIIPVYNQWAYTAACLRSLADTPGRYSFEIIVVDDQSSDESADQLAGIDGIRYLRNPKNLGFVGSCNRGAEQAQGKYLVLLNNDTQVMGGWLDALIDTFDQDRNAGLVGARLVYPDGTLQEAGGIVFNDGSGWNYGRGDDAERPDYHFMREVDYCSGACIALRTGLFHQLGGLDTRYAPAYYEDTDLAFRVRKAGYKVLVQPLSAVIHHEGVTAGTDTTAGTKKYQLINQKTFVRLWHAELESQPDKITNPGDRTAIRAAADHRIRGRILYIDATTPEPDQDSGSVRLTGLLKICRDLGYGVTFFADNRSYTGRYTQNLQKQGIEVLYRPWLESLHDFFRDRGAEYDYIFISRHYVAINYISLLKRYCPQARFIFDTVDLHYLREQRLAELEHSLPLKRTAQQTRRAEMSVIKAADATVVVSSVEQEVLAADAPGEKVHVLSNIHEVPGTDVGFADRQDLFFVGGYQHPPNIDAACWFVNDIWPLIHLQLPQARFHLIGSKAPQKVRSLHADGVIFHGFVESLEPFLDGCRLAVAPLRYGAGIKGKVNISMAHGQPVVATTAAVEGMFAEHKRELLIADDAESFAREVVRLYKDRALWERLSKASVENVATHFSVKAARASLLALFESLDTQPGC